MPALFVIHSVCRTVVPSEHALISPPLSPSLSRPVAQVKHARRLGLPAYMMSGQTTTEARRQNTAAMNALDAAGTAHRPGTFGKEPPPHTLVFLTLEKLFAMFNGCSSEPGVCPYRTNGEVYRAVQGAIKRGGVTALVVDEAQEAWQSRYYRPAFDYFFTVVLKSPTVLDVRLILLTATPEPRYVFTHTTIACTCVRRGKQR